MNDFPLHLLLPLLASLLFVCGLLFIKRVSSQGIRPWTVTFAANLWAATLFSALWLQGGQIPSAGQLWQPALIALLYILGQVFTFAAIEHGDVSVATPVFGAKVIVVALLLSVFYDVALSIVDWIAVGLAAAGIAMVQWNPHSKDQPAEARKILLTVLLALMAGTSFATFDVVVQNFAPAWGPGRLIPIAYWMVAVLSLGFLPWVQPRALKDRKLRASLLSGTLLIALQALCIVYAIAAFGDAARVNVMYSMRGMWGVILAWLVAITWGGNEAKLPKRVMLARFVGASFLTLAVILVLVAA